MTRLTKPVTRVTAPHNPYGTLRRDINITLEPGGLITLREARRRQSYSITVDSLFLLLIRREHDAKQKEKSTKRAPSTGGQRTKRKSRKEK